MFDLSSFGFYLPTKVIVETGASQQLPALCAEHGEKVLFVYSADLEDVAADAKGKLTAAGLKVTAVAQNSSEPTCDFIDNTTSELKNLRFDVVVGLGGGSAMDLAKAFAISLTQEAGIWMYANLPNRPPLPLTRHVLPVITLPTTAGTGSEVTPYSVLTKEDTQQKGTIQEPAIFPRATLIDPALTMSMPPELTAATGVDALAHALEATINVSKAAPMAELFGIAAMKLIFKSLPAVVADGSNLQARKEMAFAATLAGMAISHRGTTTTHAIAEPLGALTHIPHGLCVAISTVPVLRHSLPDVAQPLARLWREVLNGEPMASDTVEAYAFVDALDMLIKSVGLSRTARGVVGDKKCEGLVELLLKNILEFKFRPLKQHPVEFDEETLMPILNDIVG